MKKDDLSALLSEIQRIRMDLDLLTEDVASMKKSIAVVSEKAEEVMADKNIKKAQRALEKEPADEAGVRKIDDAAEEYGLSTRARTVLIRRKMHRMADFRYIDLETLKDLRNAGDKTVEEIVAFAEHYGFQIPERLDWEPPIANGKQVLMAFDSYGIPKGTVLKVISSKKPGPDYAVIQYECSCQVDGERLEVILTPSEIRATER